MCQKIYATCRHSCHWATFCGKWKIYHQLKLGHGSLQDCTIEEMGGWRRCQRMWHSCHKWCLNLTLPPFAIVFHLTLPVHSRATTTMSYNGMFVKLIVGVGLAHWAGQAMLLWQPNLCGQVKKVLSFNTLTREHSLRWIEGCNSFRTEVWHMLCTLSYLFMCKLTWVFNTHHKCQVYKSPPWVMQQQPS